MTEAVGAPVEVSLAEDGTISVPSRDIPLPTTLSAEATRFLQRPRQPVVDTSALATAEDWTAYAAAFDSMFDQVAAQKLAACEGRSTVETTELDGVTVHVARPVNQPAERETWVRLTVHGGAFVLLGGAYARAEAAETAARSQCLTIGVDYRMPPCHPFPAALDDVNTVLSAVLREQPEARVALSGASAGGNIVVGATLRARDAGLPLPACVIASTPAADLTHSGDSFVVNLGLDHMLTDITAPSHLYAGGADLEDPHLSPVFGDYSGGFPPTMITTGTRDLLLSPSVMLHRAMRRGGVDADLHVWEAASHGGFPTGAERDDHDAEEDRFLTRHLG